MSFTMTTIMGRLIKSNGEPVAGALVTATLSEVIHNGGTSFGGTAFGASTSATGVFELTVPSNTDEGTYPSGSYYTLVCKAAELESEVIVQPSSIPVQLANLPPAPSATGEVASVFGRTGAVVAKSGDYTVAEVTSAASEAFAVAEAKAAVEGKVAPSVFVMPFAASAPGTPVEGQTYYDTTKKEIGVYTGTEWIYTGVL
jgi:hypothetical protein